MTVAPDTDLRVLDAFDRERGLRLSRLVTLAFGGVIALATVILLVAGVVSGTWTQRTFVTVLGACVAGLVCYALAWSLVSRKQLRLGATLILVGFIGILTTVQVLHGRAAGLDAVVVSIFGIYGILCALAGVLVDTRYMFTAAVVVNVLNAALCFTLPHVSPGTAALVWLIVSFEDWLAVLLTFGAQTLYTQTARELGDLRVAVERAQRLDDLKNQFIRSVNHELRNPIMAWYSAAVTMQEGDAYLTPELRLKLADRSVDIGKRVLKLLRSILDVPLLDAQAKDFTPQTVAIRPVIDSALELLDPQEGGDVARDIHVTVPPDLAIWGDEVRLQQILVNLFSNGLKYSASGMPLEVTASLAASGKTALITVRDHGLGVPPAEQSLLFERFVRLPRDLTSPVGGNGLGLYLCRVLAEAMGGSIRLTSSGIPGEGSTFTVELPIAPAPAALLAAPVTVGASEG